MLTVWLRQADTTRPRDNVQLGFQVAGGSYAVLYNNSATVGPQWQRFDFTFSSNQAFDVNAAWVYFNFGHEAGVTEIGGLALTNSSATSGSNMVTPADWVNTGAWSLGGGATQNTISLSGPPFAQAKRVVVPQVTTNPWDVSTTVRNSAPITTGDTLVLTLWLRQADTTRLQANVQFGFQQAGGSYAVVYNSGATFGPQWQRFDFTFSSTRAFAVDEAWVYLNFGHEVGTTEIGGLALTKYGASGGNTAVLPANWLTGVGPYTGTFGTQSTVAAANNSPSVPLPFTQAKRFQVTTVPPNPWEIGAVVLTTAPINTGDHLLLPAWIRSADPARPMAEVDLGVQQASGAYTGLGGDRFTATATWTRIDLPVTANQAYAAGEARVYITFGSRLQTIDIGGVTLTDTTTGSSSVLLPQPDNTYIGRDPAASWRAAADARLDQVRKANLSVTVRDQNGVPIDGALVRADLTRLAFDYDSAIGGSLLVNNTTADAVTYRSKILQLFNTATLENDLKWPEWQANRQLALDAANWVVSNGLKLRGHNLLWPSWNLIPSSTGALSGTYKGTAWSGTSPYASSSPPNVPASQAEYNAHVTADGLDAAKTWLTNRLHTHISDEAAALAGKVYVWDVVNEPYWNHAFMDLLGQTSILDWYSAAHTADPNVLLALNDQNLIESADPAHQDATYNWAKYLQDNATLGGRNARLDVNGFQSHFGGSGLSSLDTIGQRLDRFAALGTRMEVTEFDINTFDEQLQADYTRDYLKYIFSYPARSGFVEWGFREGLHWLPQAAMLRSDWTVKPNGQVWIDTTQQLWDTDATGTSWQGGQFGVRGFQGTYRVAVTYAGQTVTVPVTLAAGGSAVTVTLPLQLPPGGGNPIDDGPTEPSVVPSPAVTFRGLETLDPAAFVLAPQTGAVVPLSWTTVLGNGGTVSDSLADGNGVLRTDAPKVYTTAGDADQTDAFFPPYEDANSDRTADGLDCSLLGSPFQPRMTETRLATASRWPQ